MRPVDRLPPLTALRAFEAVARKLSFARAAEELHVTKAAVAQQVRALEQEIGAPLVERSGRGLALTEAGAAGAPGLAEGFAIARPRGPRHARGQGAAVPGDQFEPVVRRDLARRPDRPVQGAAIPKSTCCSTPIRSTTRSIRGRPTR